MFASSLSLWRKSTIYLCILLSLVWHALIKARKPEFMTCEMLYQTAHRQAVTVKGILQQPKLYRDGTIFAQLCDETGIMGMKIDQPAETVVWQQGRALTVTGVLHSPPGRRPWLQIYQADLLLEL
jgi:hypothetical protein